MVSSQFCEHYIKRGLQGGQDAARKLIQAVEAHVKIVDPGVPSNVSYCVYVFANVGGLTNAYRDAQILGDKEKLTLFIRGFNQGGHMCHFEDVGYGKDFADDKIRGECLRPATVNPEDKAYRNLQYLQLVSRKKCPMFTAGGLSSAPPQMAATPKPSTLTVGRNRYRGSRDHPLPTRWSL